MAKKERKKGFTGWLFGSLSGWLVVILLISVSSIGLGMLAEANVGDYLVNALLVLAAVVTIVAYKTGPAMPSAPQYKTYIYIRLDPERIMVRNLQSGRIFDEPAIVAIEKTPEGQARTLHAVGREAQATIPAGDIRHVRPLAAAPAVIADFDAALGLLEHAVAATAEDVTIILPYMVVHWAGEPAGVLGTEDRNAFRKMADACGARDVFVTSAAGFMSDEEVIHLVATGENGCDYE